MGEVYRARDTRLDRTVAIKVLPEHVAADSQSKQRFEREAKTLAALSHPHICPVFDVGSQGGIDFLVMEHLEGETLEQRLKRGAPPLPQALQIVTQIAEALAAAHRAGIVHRDLKPGNIMLTKAGAKLLDFGLAKLRPFVIEYSEQPTQDRPITAHGTIVGTLHYMAPEQLEGREADSRTDVFAFGTVLYEILTGKRAFDGQTEASVIASIMGSEPPTLSALQPLTPQPLDRLVRKCLRKNPDARWQSVHDVADELHWIAELPPHSPALAAEPAPSVQRSRVQYVWPTVAIILATAALIGTVRFMRGAPTSPSIAPSVRFTVGPPERGQLPPQNTLPAMHLAVSPDGTMVAFSGTDAAGSSGLWIRNLDRPVPTPLAGTENASWPFWSPDNRVLGFFVGGRLMKVAVSGGPAQSVAEAEPLGVGAWSPRGVILFTNGPGPLYRISDRGGTATVATELNLAAGEVTHGLPNFLPDGEHYLFLARSSKPQDTAVYVAALNTRERKRVLLASSGAVYVQPGYVLFHRDGTLMAQPFDVARLEVSGEAVPVVEGLQFDSVNRAASFAASHTGVLAYRTGIGASPRMLVSVTRSGQELPLALPQRGYQQPRISPDGRLISVQIEERENQIWIYDTIRETLTRLTFQGSQNETAVWTPDAKRLTYYSNQAGGPLNLFWQAVDGSSRPERLTTNRLNQSPMSWSPDGLRLAYTEANAPDRDIWVLDMTDGKSAPFIKTPFTEGGAQFSPDGRWIAYASNESGRGEVYVQPYPGPGGKWQISTGGGSEPMWNRNGRELFYRSGDRMMAVPVSTGEVFSSGRPELLFERRYVAIQFPQTFQYYDVDAKGQRFVMVKETEQSPSTTHINIVLNWFAELKRLVPTN